MSRQALGRWIVTAVLLLAPAAAQANIGPQWWGDRAAEPLGLKGVAITREDLEIDLRPLADREPARISVTYHLRNSGPARRLDLLFVSGSPGVEDFEVRLDGRLVKSRPLSEDEQARYGKELPKSWRPPRGGYGLHWQPPEVALLAFRVDLLAGVSTLATRYRVRACGVDYSRPNATWKIPYILAPAREWESFGELQVTAHVPDGWEAWSTLTLEQDGSVLRARFTGLPADAFTLATRAPVGPEYQQARTLYGSLYAVAVLGGGVLCFVLGGCQGLLLARWGRSSSFEAAPVAALLGVLWAMAIGGAGRLFVNGITASLHGQESPYFHEQLFHPIVGTCFLILLALPGGFGLALWGARLGFKARRTAGDAQARTSAGPTPDKRSEQ
jgi:hypothetical protein